MPIPRRFTSKRYGTAAHTSWEAAIAIFTPMRYGDRARPPGVTLARQAIEVGSLVFLASALS